MRSAPGGLGHPANLGHHRLDEDAVDVHLLQLGRQLGHQLVELRPATQAQLALGLVRGRPVDLQIGHRLLDRLVDQVGDPARRRRVPQQHAPQLQLQLLDVAGGLELLLGAQDLQLGHVPEVHGQEALGLLAPTWPPSFVLAVLLGLLLLGLVSSSASSSSLSSAAAAAWTTSSSSPVTTVTSSSSSPAAAAASAASSMPSGIPSGVMAAMDSVVSSASVSADTCDARTSVSLAGRGSAAAVALRDALLADADLRETSRLSRLSVTVRCFRFVFAFATALLSICGRFLEHVSCPYG